MCITESANFKILYVFEYFAFVYIYTPYKYSA